MCDIGRFDYHWIEGDERLQRPLLRDGSGHARADGLANALVEARRPRRRRPAARGAAVPASRRTRRSRSCSCIGRLGGAFGLPEDGVAISWRTREKPQPPDAKFKIPPVDAPNVQRRARPRLPGQGRRQRRGRICPRSAPRSSRDACRRSTCSIPGPTARSATSRGSSRRAKSGKLPLLIVQGVLMTDLAHAADIVLPGAAWVEKDGAYVNGQGRLQARVRA